MIANQLATRIDRKNPEKTKALLVVWRDACADYGWRFECTDREMTVQVVTLGWLVRETKTELSLALSVSASGKAADMITIPKAWIKKRRRVNLA